MEVLPTPVEVRLAASPADRDDAVRSAGALLVQAGFCDAGYVASLLRREQVATTYLGQGVAIPHGMVEDKGLVRRTGLAVLQVPDGVAWGSADKPVHLVVAIAAASDEHITVLRRLTRLMQGGNRIAQLVRSARAEDIVAALTSDAAPDAAAAPAQDFSLGLDLTLNYPNGLHARPAGQWAQLAARFQAALRVRHGEAVADARNMAALLSLGAGRGAALRLSAQGPDAEAALAALRDLVQRLGDEETRQAELAAARQSQAQGLGRVLGDWQPAARQTISGIAASPGLVIGTLVSAEAGTLEVADQHQGFAEDAALLDRALNAAAAQIYHLAEQARAQGRAEQAGIFDAHGQMLRDPALLREVSRLVVQGHGAAWAWRHVLAERVATQRAVADATLAARAADLQDVGERVLRHLLGRGDDAGTDPSTWPRDALLLADDLSPSVTAQIDVQRVKGFCTARGGPTAHTAILARALGLPAVVAAGPGVLHLAPGERAILDGYRGQLHVAPTEEALLQTQAMVERLARHQAEEAASRLQPATTTDGHTVEIAANVNRADQVARALEQGAEGVGLMRTEFLFLERDHAPDEEEQFAVYQAMVQAMGGRPLIVRTLDIGGDKQVPHLNLPVEENPFLGVRGARLCLQRDDLLMPQLRALVRAAQTGPLSIMFPMISTVDEVRQLKARLAEVQQQLGMAGRAIPVGIMIEVPSAARMADRLAAHVDFFSIGTNDLTQYTLAVDRQHPQLAGMADSLHPAVLRLVADTVAGARRHGRWVGVCGGLAGEPLGAALLAGLGVQELSMSVGDLTAIKALLRRHSLAELQALAQRALDMDDGDQVRALGAQLRAAPERV
ncbi:MAG: phosphoenolpyruvate--protein phosphotransferase [Variovorax paradoxus]|nr:MAG: phosphoenolpyruvate--protein phosphotransferase [Variovorax paradoxus]PZQ16745.1 MAG: phosphoenolpyruvate--protein phosphotransferase [Variovorax paradoxus]